MTDLSDFGGGIDTEETAEDDEDEPRNWKYRTGRCRGIDTDGQRCSAPVTEENASRTSEDDLCHMHGEARDPVTIDGDPLTLIKRTSRSLNVLDEVSEAIHRAIHQAVGLEDRPIPFDDNAIYLPARYARARRIVIRTPTTTMQSSMSGGEPERRHAGVSADDYDNPRGSRVRNPRCLPDGGERDVYEVGLKIFGQEQQWFPVEFVDQIE